MVDQSRPFARPGLARRAAPFALVMLAALAAAPILPGAEREPVPLIAAGVLSVVIVAAPLVVPWRRLPSSAQAVPPISYLLVVALLREDGSGGASAYEALALLPVIWLALYGTLRQVAGAVFGALCVFLAPAILDGGSTLPERDLWQSAFAVVIGATVVFVFEAARQADLRGDSESQLQAVVETMSDGLLVVDAAGRPVMWNRVAGEMLQIGGNDAEVSGWSEKAALLQTEVPGNGEAEELPLARAVNGERVTDRRLLINAREGHERRWASVSAVPLSTDTGSPTGGVAVLRDITDRKRAEQYAAAQNGVSRALAESSSFDDALPKLLKAIGESMRWALGAFWSAEAPGPKTDPSVERGSALRVGALWHASHLKPSEIETRCEPIDVLAPADLVGRVWEDATPGWERDITHLSAPRMQAAAALGLGAAICFPVVASGRVLGVLEFFARQMSDAPKDLTDAMAAMGSQIGEFMERKRAEREADRKKDEFFALVSHELRTPLTSIVGYLDLLLEDKADELDDEARGFLEIASRNGDRLLRLVGDLLLVAQVQSGRFVLRPGTVELSSVAAQSVEAARAVAEQKEIYLSLEDESVPELSGDASRLAQLLDNLLSNALKFAPDGERVQIRLSSTDDRAIVDVSNTGSYIPPDEAARLFERFFRGSNATEQVIPGIGLGLTIVRAIVEAHGGEVGVESRKGVGTTFSFWLPLDKPPRESDPEASREEEDPGEENRREEIAA